MNFLNLSPLGLVVGLAVIAAALYLLQRLRVRYREHPIATTMFWAAAVQEAPVRVFQQRFRHWLAYLLSLLLCWLLWTGFAGPITDDRRSAGFNVLVLDGSAHAAVGDDFEQSKELLLDDIAQYPTESREVFLSGAHNVKLLLPGEERPILERRIAELEPAASPAKLAELVRQLALDSSYPEQVNVVIYGRAQVPAEILESIPRRFRLSWITPNDGAISNRGIAALGIAEAISGSWDKVDVLIRFVNSEEAPVSREDFEVQIGDRALESSRLESIGDNDFRIRNVVADGSSVNVALRQPDDLDLDDVASVLLPLKQPIKVTVGGSVPDVVIKAIASDSGIEVVANDAVVAIVGPTDTPGNLPSFRLVNSTVQNVAFRIGYVGDQSAEEALTRSVIALGLSQIDAMTLATELDQEIGVELEVGNERYVSLWVDIVGDQFNFTDTLSFPLFVSKTLRYLAEEKPWYAYLAASRPAYEQTADESLTNSDLLSEYALGSYYVRNTAGSFETADGSQYIVALLDETLTARTIPSERDTSTPEATAVDLLWGLTTWLMLAALLLVGTDWYFYQRGLMP